MTQPRLPFDGCDFCGEPYRLEVLEHYPAERTFTTSACCEEAHADALAWAEDIWSARGTEEERRGFRAWFARETGAEIRSVALGEDGAFRYGNGGFTLDYGLALEDVDLKTARGFVAKHHRHNRPPVGWRWGHAVRNGAELVAVAMVGRPVARALDHRTIVEVNRVCVDPGVPRELAAHACSMLYGAACREAQRRRFRKVVTYTLESERGSWNTPARARRNAAPTCRKVRWSRTLTPR
jgi:hypothetical protein